MAGEKEKGKGLLDEVKGKVKKAVSDLTEDERMRSEGEVDEKRGEHEQRKGDLQEKTSEDVERKT